jgi:hypothetical protein
MSERTSTWPAASREVEAPLLAIAAKLCWWEAPEEAVRHRHRFVAQVMTLGTWDDVQTLRNEWGEEVMRAVLHAPPPGVFDAASWAYWHRVLGVSPVPPLPSRHL